MSDDRHCNCCGAELCAKCRRRAPVGPWSDVCTNCRKKTWNRWTASELRLLRAAYANHHVRGLPAAIAEHVNHPAEAIAQRANKLGLTKPKRQGIAKVGVCDVCTRSTGNHPVLDVRGLDLYLICRRCSAQLNPPYRSRDQGRRINAARG